MTTDNVNILKSDYLPFLEEIKGKIKSARIQVFRKANKELILLYLEIGERIVEKQEQLGWGKSIVEKLSNDLKKEFPTQTGYSTQNLWYMRQFYLTYKDFPNLQQLVGEIPWGQNLVIMSRVKDNKEKEFYIRKTFEYGWTRDVLIHQIEAGAHLEIGTKKMHNFPQVLPEHLAEQADKALKDSYILDFLDISKPLQERQMEKKLIVRFKDFITELGLGFCLIGTQYKIKLSDKEYFIDLLFFHRKLKSLVAIELKVGAFKPEYAGKMNFYLNLLDDFVRMPDENPSIGIIICKDRNRFDVEYALKRINSPIGVSGYKLTRKLPADLQKELPTVEDLREGLKDIGEF
jgi:predicted nuclease of restriction endonuclease-like (RecB) superfamily